MVLTLAFSFVNGRLLVADEKLEESLGSNTAAGNPAQSITELSLDW
jgi:hypothetical protein